MTEAEIKTLPLTSRNPYNFALLQPGVVGFETNEFGVPRITANGALLRVNYQMDGSNNTQKDRAGLRQMPMSEVMIREVKVVTTRLRAGVWPDDGYGLQRDHAVGDERRSRARAATACSGSRWWRFRSSRPARIPRTASRRPTSTSTRSTSAARSFATRRISSAATSTPSATCPGCSVITHHAGQRSRRWG